MRHLLILLWAMAGFAAAQQPAAPPPPPGVPQEAKWFNGSWFKVYFEPLDWRQSKKECERLGGQLAVIPDEATWNFVKQLTKQRVWLGASDEEKEGQWKWIDGSPWSYLAWDDGEPNNVNKKEHYLCRSPFGGWADTVEKWDGYAQWAVSGYLCQWKTPGEKTTAVTGVEIAAWDAGSGIVTLKSQERLKAFRVAPETTITLNGLKSSSGAIARGFKVAGFAPLTGNAEVLGTLALEGVTTAPK